MTHENNTDTPQGNAPRKNRWSSRSMGGNFQHQFFYLLIRLGGRRLAYAFLHVVVLFYSLFNKQARERCSHYLKRRFPHASPLQMRLHAHKLALSFGRVLVDRALVGILGREKMRVDFPDEQIMRVLMAEKKGFILMNAHVGCWQVAMSAMDFMETPVNMLLTRAEGDVDRHYFEHRENGESGAPYKTIDPSGYLGGALEMIAALKNGEVLCVMGDRVFGSDKNTLRATFLGQEAQFPYSAYKLASATGRPIALFLSRKTGPDSYELRVPAVIRVPPDLGRGAAPFRPYVQEMLDALERYAYENPYQFYNFHDMWSEEEQPENNDG